MVRFSSWVRLSSQRRARRRGARAAPMQVRSLVPQACLASRGIRRFSAGSPRVSEAVLGTVTKCAAPLNLEPRPSLRNQVPLRYYGHE